MRRKKFIQSSLLGISAVSIAPAVLLAKFNNDDLEKRDEKAFENNKPKILRSNKGKKLNVIGDNQNIKLTGEDTGGQFTLIEEVNKPGVGIPPHVHENEDEIFHIIEGELEVTVGKDTTILNAGDIIFCPRGIPHSWKVIGKQDARVILSIFPAGIERMFEELDKLPKGPPDLEMVKKICSKYKISFV